ncbi:hypothetical protein ABZ611_23995 [Streptomyces sp. NPDC007861]|uniref:hypothetical protein n=1 Tax=Streptomyces sp. NPDC007861 TaxID=3154893 RepID=UPI0033D2F3C9
MERTEECVDFRLSTAQLAVPLVGGVALATGLLCLAPAWTADPMAAAELRACAFAGGAGVIGALVRSPHGAGARLTLEHLVIVSSFGRRRRIRWADVSRIDVRRTAGVRQVSVSLVTGERLVLAAPMSFLDPRFDARVGELTDRWHRHRGLQPVAALEDDVQRDAHQDHQGQ